MFKDFIDKIAAQYSKNLPFVAYRKPKERNVNAVLQFDVSINYLTDFLESGFVFAPFDTQKKIVLLPCDERLQAAMTSVQTSNNESTRSQQDETQKEFHIDLVKRGIEGVHKGEFEKVVLSRRVAIDCTTPPVDLFQRLLANYQNAFCYLWHHPEIGTWLGATPEILLKSESHKITTMSLAGTQMYKGEDNPNWGSKELEEQELVTNFIANALQDKVSNLSISKRESFRAGGLMHLRTKLTADYQKGQLSKIIGALHPTPAVCGMPMMTSRAFILKNENYDREYYTGYLGELNLKVGTLRSSRRKNQENRAYKSLKTTTTFFVNLRSMQLKEDKALIYVGGGVTKDSDPYKEWEETVAKTNTMLKILSSD